MSAQGINEEERRKLLQHWERVTFRIFGLFGKDSRTKIGDYVKIGYVKRLRGARLKVPQSHQLQRAKMSFHGSALPL
jgi:hypothetical protein